MPRLRDIPAQCPVCGKSILVCQYDLDRIPRGLVCCSTSCGARKRWLLGQQTFTNEPGPKHQNWKEGKVRTPNGKIRASNEQDNTQHKTRRALESGKLVKQPCLGCGSLEVEAHHEDYTKPLEVIWLCHSCHMLWHAEKRRRKDDSE